jgi:hypothetical protein
LKASDVNLSGGAMHQRSGRGARPMRHAAKI